MNRQEAIERLKGNVSAVTLYVTEAKLDEEEIENELLNIKALEMAIEALQFQDIMVNNPKSAKPTPEVCKNCTDNKQGDWIPVSEGLPNEYGNYLITMGDGAVDIGTCGTPPIDSWSACDANGFYQLEDEEVIAWQPLPEPYKEGDTE